MTRIQLRSGGCYDFDRAVITGPFDAHNDVAVPLSCLNRFVGHTTRPWDVAVHSIVVARTIEAVTGEKNAAAAGLMHELHEAIIGDIPTPVAQYLGREAVSELKRDAQYAAYERLGTQPSQFCDAWDTWVELADCAALLVEKQLLMVPESHDWGIEAPGHTWMLAAYRHTREWLDGYDPADHAAGYSSEWRRLVAGPQ